MQIFSGQSFSSIQTFLFSIFIKLIAPVGTPECIQHNILKPLLYLVAAASPMTAHGLVYGFPLLWKINAKGIAQFRLGGIAAMSVIRGSFETTFNKDFQPTVVDVRLTIVPLLTSFASQVGDAENIYELTNGNNSPLSIQHPGDISTGTMQTNQNESIVSIKL